MGVQSTNINAMMELALTARSTVMVARIVLISQMKSIAVSIAILKYFTRISDIRTNVGNSNQHRQYNLNG